MRSPRYGVRRRNIISIHAITFFTRLKTIPLPTQYRLRSSIVWTWVQLVPMVALSVNEVCHECLMTSSSVYPSSRTSSACSSARKSDTAEGKLDTPFYASDADRNCRSWCDISCCCIPDQRKIVRSSLYLLLLHSRNAHDTDRV